MTIARWIVLGLFILSSTFATAQAAERIVSFVSDVQIERNGELAVVETILIRAEGQQVRRGILRDFPTRYTRKDGTRVEVGFIVESVSRDNSPENYVTERLANGVRVRIGRADTFISSGLHRYVIRYRTTRQIGFFSDFDELYWNATGNGWTFPIDMAEARIALPENVPFTQSAFYTGPQGATGKDATIVEQRPGRIVFRTTRPLPVRNGLTVAAGWAKGVVTPPDPTQQMRWLLQDNPALPYAGFGLVFVVMFYSLAWMVVGRDPRRGTIIPLFAPPEGMSAAAVRYVSRMGFDKGVFTAAIIGLGVNGRLKLIGDSTAHEIKRRDGGRAIDEAERAVESALFASGPTVKLDQSDHKPISDAQFALTRVLRRTYNGKLFSNNYWWSFFGFLASAAIVAAIGHSFVSTFGSRAPGMMWGMLLPLPAIMLGVGVIRAGWRRDDRSGRRLQLVGFLAAAGFAAVGIAIMSVTAGFGVAILPGIAPYLLAPFAILGFGWLQAPSVAGREVMDRIEGFRQYLSVAEEDRLEALNPPEKTPELFERFLPYAVALDVQNTWARRFAGVLAVAATGAAVGSWYSGDHSITSDPVSFADGLGRDLSQTIASASSPPGSSDSGSGGGSSGGGSSGGGGGGGGGSGW